MKTIQISKRRFSPEVYAQIWADICAGVSVRGVARKYDITNDYAHRLFHGQAYRDFYSAMCPDLIAKAGAIVTARTGKRVYTGSNTPGEKIGRPCRFDDVQYAAIWADLDAGMSLRAMGRKWGTNDTAMSDIAWGNWYKRLYEKVDPDMRARVHKLITSRSGRNTRAKVKSETRPMVMFLAPASA